jgi:hypothetical protein
MYTRIYQNSYVVLIITFILLLVIFYIFEIGYSTVITPTGKVVKKFNWMYPLAISLIVWVIWHFFLYPPAEVRESKTTTTNEPIKYQTTPTSSKGNNKLTSQHINMNNWN